MTRPLPLATVALLVVAACSAPEAPQVAATPVPTPEAATPPPVSVHILVPEEPDPAVGAWAEALAEAISSGQGGLALAATPEEASAVVRIDAVEQGTEADRAPEGEGEVQVMRGALIVGESAREFNLAYRGDARTQAEALARNLRRFALEGASEEEAAGSDGEDADVGDEG